MLFIYPRTGRPGEELPTGWDLIPGARVVVDIPEGNKEMLAHSVKIGVAAKTVDSHTHDSQ